MSENDSVDETAASMAGLALEPKPVAAEDACEPAGNAYESSDEEEPFVACRVTTVELRDKAAYAQEPLTDSDADEDEDEEGASGLLDRDYGDDDDDDDDDEDYVPEADAADDDVDDDDDEDEGDYDDEGDDEEDGFPYEENIFVLSDMYSFQERLAVCDTSVVYRARERSTGKTVVLKILEGLPKDGKHPREVRFLTEAQGHPCLPVLYRWHPLPATDCFCLVMKFFRNGRLEDHVYGRSDCVRKYMQDLLGAIKHLHSNKLLFRDVKTANILWDPRRGCARLIDFDIVTKLTGTPHRSVVGTDGHMAPELLALEAHEQKEEAAGHALPGAPEGYGAPVDMFAAGVVLGQLLFEIFEDDVENYNDEHDDQISDELLRRVEALERAGKGTAAHCLLRCMLSKDPATRIPVGAALSHPYFTGDEERCRAMVERARAAAQARQIREQKAAEAAAAARRNKNKQAAQGNRRRRKKGARGADDSRLPVGSPSRAKQQQQNQSKPGPGGRGSSGCAAARAQAARAAAGGMAQCGGCRRNLSKSLFSKNQLRKGPARQCRNCLQH